MESKLVELDVATFAGEGIGIGREGIDALPLANWMTKAEEL